MLEKGGTETIQSPSILVILVPKPQRSSPTLWSKLASSLFPKEENRAWVLEYIGNWFRKSSLINILEHKSSICYLYLFVIYFLFFLYNAFDHISTPSRSSQLPFPPNFMFFLPTPKTKTKTGKATK